MNKNKKGISIIIATIIIISLCIAITIFSILWYSGIIQKFIFYEKIEIIDVWSKKSFNDYFFISIDFKNVGNTIVKVCNVKINGKPPEEFSYDTKVLVGSVRKGWYLDPNNEETFIDVKPGERGDIGIAFPPYAASVGQKIHITIYTVNGGEYHVSLILEE
jgi:hypothetical protein